MYEKNDISDGVVVVVAAINMLRIMLITDDYMAL